MAEKKEGAKKEKKQADRVGVAGRAGGGGLYDKDYRIWGYT